MGMPGISEFHLLKYQQETSGEDSVCSEKQPREQGLQTMLVNTGSETPGITIIHPVASLRH